VKGNGITMAPRAPALATVLVATLALVACSAPPAASTPTTSPPSSTAASPAASAATAYPMTLTDDSGREVEIAAAPQRIVSLAPSNTEIVCALGACDRLVGVTDFDDYPDEVTGVPDVVIGAQVDVERVVDAEPDLVLAAGNEITPTAVIDQLVDLGLPVVAVYPDSLEGVYDDIELVGTALGVPGAPALVADMKDRVASVVAAVAGADRPRTLYEVFYAEGTLYTAGDGSFLAALVDLAGGTAVVGDAQGALDPEHLVEAAPELILLGSASYDESLATPEDALATVAARPGWAELPAVTSGRVVPFLDDIVTTRPGPRIVDGLEALARAIHPDAFDG
jgi:iron complex transport system substrate-binding protein